MRLLLIHGRGQAGKDPATLEREWVEALTRGYVGIGRPFPTDLAIDFPFYGDVLENHVTAADLPSPEAVRSKGGAENRAFEKFLAQALTEIKDSDPRITDESVEAEIPAGESRQKGPQNWPWVIAIARAIDRRLTGAADFTIEQFLRDVFLYMNRRVARKEIDEIVAGHLTNEPTVVVGHSLGTVVGYNVLRAASEANVVKYVTVGSPLGIRSINGKLGIPENPFGAAGWFNAFDPQDIVALNPLDDPNFPTDPVIFNDNGVDNHTDNHHGIVGYLDDSDVARHIADALESMAG